MIFIQDNIYLKSISIEDVPFIFDIIDKERGYLREWLPFVDATREVSFTQSYVQNILDSKKIQYSIYEDQSLIGLIGFNNLDRVNRKTEIGYWISEEKQGRGIITSSVKKLLEIAFLKLDMNSVRIKAAIANRKSRNIPEKLGFKQEGVERAGELLVDNQFTDLAIYSILKEEYTHSV